MSYFVVEMRGTAKPYHIRVRAAGAAASSFVSAWKDPIKARVAAAALTRRFKARTEASHAPPHTDSGSHPNSHTAPPQQRTEASE